MHPLPLPSALLMHLTALNVLNDPRDRLVPPTVREDPPVVRLLRGQPIAPVVHHNAPVRTGTEIVDHRDRAAVHLRPVDAVTTRMDLPEETFAMDHAVPADVARAVRRADPVDRAAPHGDQADPVDRHEALVIADRVAPPHAVPAEHPVRAATVEHHRPAPPTVRPAKSSSRRGVERAGTTATIGSARKN